MPIVRAALARRLLRHRARGGPDRHHLPGAGDPALRRLPGQRLRAVADPRRRGPARPAGGVRHRAQRDPRGRASRRSSPTCATRRRWPGRGRCPGTAGLEHRIGGIEKADGTGNISYDPANHDFMVRTRQAKVDGDRRDDPAAGGRGPGRRGAGAGARLGLDVRPDRRGLPARARRAAARSRRPTCATSTRSRADLGEVLRRYDKVLIPEMNLGQLGACSMLAREVPRRRDRLQPGARAAVHGRGARRSDHRRCSAGAAVTRAAAGPQGLPALDLVPKAA